MENRATANNIPPMAAPALPRSSQSISAKSFAAEANTFIDADIAIKATPVDTIFSGFIFFKSAKKPVTSARTTPIPVIPLAIPFQSKEAKSLAAEANTFIDAAIAIKATPIDTKSALFFFEKIPFFVKENTFSELLANFESATIAPIAIAIRLATPATPFPIPSKSKPDRDFKADARIRIAADIPIIRVAILLAPLISSSNLSNIFRDPISSPKHTVMAVRAVASLSSSILDNTHKDAARIPIEIAMFLIMSAFMLFCHASKESPTVPRTSLIDPTNPPVTLSTSLKPLIHFLIPNNIVVNIPLLTKSNSDLISPFRKALPIVLPILENTLPTAFPTFLIAFQIVVRTITNASKPGVVNFSFT